MTRITGIRADGHRVITTVTRQPGTTTIDRQHHPDCGCRTADPQPTRTNPKEHPVDFHTALNQVVTDLTPQPWDYTDTTGTILTVIPAGLPEAPSMAEVLIRITLPGADPIEAGILTTDLPAMIDALTANRMWSYETLIGMYCDLAPFGGGGMLLILSEDVEAVEAQPQVHVPEGQRLPLASALGRALDVARGWEGE